MYQPPSEEILKTLETAPNMYLVLSPDLYILTASDRYLEATETTRETIAGKHIFDAFPDNPDWPEADGVKQINASLQEVLRTKKPHYMRIQKYDVPDHSQPGKFIERYWDPSHTPVLNAAGEISYIIQLATNVTEKVLAEQAQKESQAANLKLRQSESDFRLLIEQAPVAMLVFRGADLIIDLANQAILDILDKDASIIGKPLLEGMPELKGEPAVELLFDIYHKGISSDGVEVPVKMQRDGITETRYFNFSYRPLKDRDRIIGVMDVAVEVTAQVTARRTIEWGEEQLRLAIDSAELATWYLDAGTGMFYPSERLKQLFGYRADEDMSLRDAIDQVTEPYREKVREAIEATLKTGAVFNIEHEVKSRHDQNIRFVRARGKLYENGARGSGQFFGIIADITEEKQLERRKDDFLSIASHELKTPLTSLKSTLQLLDRLREKFTEPMHGKLVEQANRSMDRISALIDDLLQVNSFDVGQLALHKTAFTVAEMLEKCCGHVRSGGKYDLILQGDEHLQVYADENRIDQVVVNFVNNAVKYAPDSKEIFLKVEKLPDFVKISVRDTGPGIAADKVPHLVNRYYRAEMESKVYSGLGLGLYICAEIVKRHGGEVGVDTSPGNGSTFWFTLPDELTTSGSNI